MKIDIHVHTKKVKNGDAETRNISPKRFNEIVSSTNVKIIAITNHNSFDLQQYQAICEEVKDNLQIWPGIELDVAEGLRKWHLLVVVSPLVAFEFSKIVTSITQGISPDHFEISIDGIIEKFDKFNPLYIAHYHKAPAISDEDITKLYDKVIIKSRVLKEVTNSISAGIYISHGHRTIYGSDVQDWNEYERMSWDLPELRLPVESYEQFCLLLDKDSSTINTILDKKTPEIFSITPFEDSTTTLNLKIYNDINIFFGAKGTGKTKILEAIAGYYKHKGMLAQVFSSGVDKIETIYDLSGSKFSIDLKDYGIDYCNNEIDFLKKSGEKEITSLSKYYHYFSTEIKNRNANKFRIKDYVQSDIITLKRKLETIINSYKKFSDFYDYLNNPILRGIVDNEKLSNLKKAISEIITDLKASHEIHFIEFKTNELFNTMIDKIRSEISRKIAAPEKPATTKFQDYAINRIEIEHKAKKIKNNINKTIEIEPELVGDLGDKGNLYCKTDVIIQDGNVTDGSLSPVSKTKIKKNSLKSFARCISKIIDNVYTSHIFERITELNSIEDINEILTLHELLLFNRYFTINNELYKPSTGERSMLLLHRELEENKEIYILDEPEKSLGNDYINDVIVPLIKEKAKAGKKIFISTHDANIAVRTLPYNSIYRMHTRDGYETYVGNPFSNNLLNINNNDIKIDWKDISMKTLEGGKQAFGERGKIYGNV